MPEFSAESWNFFKEQLVSVIRFVMYAFDLIFDAARSNPMLYAFIFFPIFFCAFIIMFDLLTGSVPFISLMKKNDNKGILSGLQASTFSNKSISGTSNAAKSTKSLAQAKAAADAKVHKNMIQAVSGNSALAGAHSAAGSSAQGNAAGTSFKAQDMAAGAKSFSMRTSSGGTAVNFDKNIKFDRSFVGNFREHMKDDETGKDWRPFKNVPDKSDSDNSISKLNDLPHGEVKKSSDVNLNIEVD